MNGLAYWEIRGDREAKRLFKESLAIKESGIGGGKNTGQSRTNYKYRGDLGEAERLRNLAVGKWWKQTH